MFAGKLNMMLHIYVLFHIICMYIRMPYINIIQSRNLCRCWFCVYICKYFVSVYNMYDVKSSTSQHFCQLFCLLSLSFCSHILGVVKRNPLFLYEIEWKNNKYNNKWYKNVWTDSTACYLYINPCPRLIPAEVSRLC